MTTKRRTARSPYTPDDARRARELEAELAELHAKRRGHYEPGENWGWCASCGRHAVWPPEGLDTCRCCLETG